ncbi:hypothetical protein ACOSQ3_013043 [Xanthoceras sorbifolium]
MKKKKRKKKKEEKREREREFTQFREKVKSDFVPQKPFPQSIYPSLLLVTKGEKKKLLVGLFLDLIVLFSSLSLYCLSTKFSSNLLFSFSLCSFASNGSASVAVQEKRQRVFIGKVKLCLLSQKITSTTASSLSLATLFFSLYIACVLCYFSERGGVRGERERERELMLLMRTER